MAQSTIPEARGFAAALETYLARGGGRRMKGGSSKGGYRFTEGPIKGMTVEQATAKARELWRSSPESVREKYAGMEASMLAPSEMAPTGYQGPATMGPGQGPMTEGPARRPSPGDRDGDGVLDVAQPPSPGNEAPAEKKTVNPNATAGAGRGSSKQPADSDDSNEAGAARAQAALNEALQTGGASEGYQPTAASWSLHMPPGMLSGGPSVSTGPSASTDKPQNPGVIETAPEAAESSGYAGPSSKPQSPAPAASPSKPAPTPTLNESRRGGIYVGDMSPEAQRAFEAQRGGTAAERVSTMDALANQDTYKGPMPDQSPAKPEAPDFVKRGIENRPDVVRARKKAEATKAAQRSLAENQRMVDAARTASADGYKGPAGGADFGQGYAGPQVVPPRGEVVRRYTRKQAELN